MNRCNNTHLKITVMNAGIVLGVGLILIAAVTEPSFVTFVLPRDTDAYARCQELEVWRTGVSVTGGMITVACFVARITNLLRTRTKA